MIALLVISSAFVAPLSTRMSSSSAITMHGGKGFGGGEATRDPEPTNYDPNDPKGKQQAIHKAESFAEYLAKRGAGGGAAPAAPAPAPSGFSGAAAAAPAAAPAGAGGDIMSTLESLQGPEIFWGADGVSLGYEESDIKGYEGFSKFIAAVKQFGVDLSGGPYTLLAPADSAFDKDIGAPITADVIKYHVIPGTVPLAQLNSDQPTLQGNKLTANRRFRKNWLDNAIIGLKSEGPSKSANWPADVACSNGLIHAIDTVLVPGAYGGENTGGYGRL